MPTRIYNFQSRLWLHPGSDSWHFFTIPPDEGKVIKNLHGFIRRGFGSIKVTATIGKTTWFTSIFPDSESHSYILPVKREVRRAEQLKDGNMTEIQLEIAE